MDPLSIATGVLAIASAAAKIGRAISYLRAFGEVPRRMYLLKNEVSDLEIVLRQLDHALRGRQTLTPDADAEALRSILVRTKGHLVSLAKVVERVANACRGGKLSPISRTTIWWKEKTTFQDLQKDIHEVRESLALILGASNSYVASIAMSTCQFCFYRIGSRL
jgi:hypothetical protein